MSLTQQQARDAIFGLVLDAWTASGAPTEEITIHFEGVSGDQPTDVSGISFAASWARASMRTIGSSQSTQGRRRFQTSGVLTVQVFTPIGDGYTLGSTYANVVLDALRAHVGSPIGVWFFEIRPEEVGVTGPWLQINAVAGFRYQEVVP